MLTFEPSFFQTEERNGFIVDQTMKTCWAAEMELLFDIDQVCQKYDIPYFVYFGTLLGAVRHEGFVPWDDDMDIALLREDYVRLMAVLKKELPAEYIVHNALEDEDATEYWSSVANADTISIEPARLEKFHGCPFAVAIDIYPLDFVPRDEKKAEEAQNLFHLVWTTRRLAMQTDLSEEQKNLPILLKEVEKRMRVKIDPVRPVVSQLVRLANQVAASIGEDDGDEVSMYINYSSTPNWKMPKECYQAIDWVPFENIFVPIPVGYDSILSTIYGEYMTPRANAQSHDYPFYKAQLEELRRIVAEKNAEG